jgi:hypothetical protein
MADTEHVPEAQAMRHTSCLGRTCMKWRHDGELTELDFRLILQRLVEVDAEASELLERTFDAAEPSLRA